MRTDLTAADRTLLDSGAYDLHWQVEVANGSGTMIDLTGRLANVPTLKLPDPNAPIGTFSAAFHREMERDPNASLSPLVTASTYNRLDDGVTYSRLLQIGRPVIARVALTARGGARPSTGYYEVFKGRVSKPDWPKYEGGFATIACRDQAGELQKVKSEEAFTYEAGTPIETVIQAVLDNHDYSHYTLRVPVASGKVLSATYAPGIQKTVWEQVWALAQSIGWVLWFRYDAAGVARLTFFEPDRAKAISDFTATGVREVNAISTNEDEIGNVARGVYSDFSGVRRTAGPVESPSSIAEYGGIRRSYWISLPEDSPVRTESDMLDLLQAAISDTAEPDALMTVTTPANPFLECAVDLVTFPADGRHFDSAQKLAPFSVTLSHPSGQDHQGSISVRGKPSVGKRTWDAIKRVVQDRPETKLINNLRARDSADGLSEIIEWTNGAKLEEVWSSTQTFTAPVDSDAWELVAASVEPMSPVLSTSLTVAKPTTEDLVRLVQIEGRYLDPATGELVVGQVWRRIVYPAPREQPVIEVDDEESDTTGTQWVKVRERGITVTQVRTRTQQGTQPITAWGTPTRSSGGVSTVKGGTLGTLEYEQDVPLDATRFSWIEFELTLETGEIKTLGPFGFDRDKRPNLIDVVVTGQKVKAVGDSADTKSIKAEKTSGAGAAWSEHVDGLNHTFSVPVGSSDTWGVRVTAYSQPKAYVTASTLSDTEDVTVQGATATAEPVWSTFAVTEPALADDVVTVTLKADSAPMDYTSRVWKQHIGVDGSFSDITANLTPALSAPPTTQTDYSWSSGVTRTQNDSGAALVEIDIRAEILNGSGVVVETETRRVSYYTGGSLI